MKKIYEKKWSYAVAFMGLLLLMSGISRGQTVYVSSSIGNDASGDGTAGNPFKTFTKGYSMVVSGGTLDLTGTFTWTDADETGDNGTDGFTLNKSITIQGPGGGLAVVQAASSLTRTQRIFYIPTGYNIILKNLELRHGYTPASGPMDGGAIACFSNLTIHNCYIHSNIARQGCGIEVGQITLNIENSTIANNVSTQAQTGLAGAGILVNSGTLTLTNSIVYNNSGVQYGGGIYLRNSPGSATITNSVIVNNSSTDLGGGIGIEGTVSLTIKNTIVANNTEGTPSNNGSDIDHFEGSITDNGYNIIEIHNSGSLTGTGTITGNQTNLFGTGISATPSLADNGTVNGTPTIALSAGSVAINAGNSSANGSVSVPTTDQRGFGRNGLTDIGSFEYNGIAPASAPTVTTQAVTSIATTTATGNGTVTATGGANVTERGVYYSTTNGFADGAGTKVSTTGDWSATGAFTQSITGLTASTTYYVKAFATNSSGTGYGAQVSFTTLLPEINLQGNSANITNGSSSPSSANHTDFGGAVTSLGTVVRTFTIQNTGTGTLTLGANAVSVSGGQAADFNVTAQPATTVSASGSTTFTIQFTPSADGLRSTTVSVANDDSDESPYTFAIQGTGLTPVAPEWSATGNYALKFNGSNSVTAPLNVDGFTAFSIEAWVRWETTTGNEIEFICGKAFEEMEIHTTSGNGIRFIPTTGVWLDASNVMPAGVWTHIAAIYQPSNSLARLYINGKEVSLTDNGPRSVGEPMQNSSADFQIGRRIGDVYYFNGSIDELRVWSTVRTEVQIKANIFRSLGSTSGLMANYRMSDGSGTSLTDNSGNGNTGTLTNSPEWKLSGCFVGPRKALDFDGTDDHVVLPAQIRTAFSGLQHFTFSGWVYPSNLNTATYGTFFSINNDASPYGRVTFHQLPSSHPAGLDDILISISQDAGSGYGEAYTNSDVFYSLSKWFHFAFVYDGTLTGNNNRLKLYVNGKLVPLVYTNDIPSSFATTFNNSFIGKHANPDYFKGGKLDEFSFWNISLTESQIREMMFKSLAGDESGLFAYYRFDQSDGTTLYDLTANGYHGNLTNMDPATDWVSSTAFNTWLGGENNTWGNVANWSNGVPTYEQSVGLYKWNLANITTYEAMVTGSPIMHNLLFSSTSAPTLSSGFLVYGNLLLERDMNLNGQTVTIGASGNLVEGNGYFSGTTGMITTTRTLNNISAQNVAGLGAILTSAANLGSTSLSRAHGSQANLPYGNSVLRSYDITPTTNTGLNATLVYQYRDAELNSLVEPELALYSSTDGGNSFTRQGGIVNATDNTLTLTGLDGFSKWTAGKDCVNPTSGGEIDDDQTICPGIAPAAITNKTLPTGHTGTLEYQWQYSVTDAVSGFVNIDLSNDEDYTPGTLTQTTWFRRLSRVDCMNDWAGAQESNTVTITVNTPGDETTYGDDSWIGYAYTGSGATAFTSYIGYVTEAATFDRNMGEGSIAGATADLCASPSGDFSIRYKMNKELPAGYYTFTVGADDGVRLSIDGGSSWVIDYWDPSYYFTYTYGPVYMNGSTNFVLEYYETVAVARISFDYCVKPSISVQPSPLRQNYCINGTATQLSVTASNVAGYQWYQNADSSYTGGTLISGATLSTYTPLTTSAGALYYYCVLSNTSACTETSSLSGQITVHPLTTINSQSTGAQTTVINGSFSPISVSASGYNLEYQWYRNAVADYSGGISLGAANGAQTDTYTPQAGDTSSVLYYYCIVNGECSSDTSDVSGKFVVSPPFTQPTGEGTEFSPYLIANLENLTWLQVTESVWDDNAYFLQTADINAAATRTWYSGSGFPGIGSNDVNFTGHYNGGGFTIDSLFMQNINGILTGLFMNAIGSEFQDIHVRNADVSSAIAAGILGGNISNSTFYLCSASGNVSTILFGGGLAGLAMNITAQKCFSDANISGLNNPSQGFGIESSEYLGGIFGIINGDLNSISDCYATGSVIGGNHIGGLIGGIDYTSVVMFGGTGEPSTLMGFNMAGCYAANTITALANGASPGGLFGQSNYTGSLVNITNSYWDGQLSNVTDGFTGGSPKLTPEMKTQSTFTGWDFTPSTGTWNIQNGIYISYPYLQGITYDVPGTTPEVNPIPGLENAPCVNPSAGGTIAADQTICYGTTPATITNTANPTGHTGTLEYKWQVSYTDAGSNFDDIVSSNAAGYTPGTSTQTAWYKRLARVDCMADWSGAAVSNTVTITVNAIFAPGEISNTGETICYNTAASEIGSVTPAGGGDESITYSWRSSADSYTADIPGADAAAYTPGTLTQTTTFRRYAKDGTCNTVPEQSTGEWTVTVYDDFTPGAIETTGETICYNTAASEIGSLTPASGGDESITYSWRSSADSYAADIPGADAATYTPGTLTQTTTFRRYANDETCNTDPEQSTGEWTVTVYDDFTPGAIETTGETICYNTAASEIGSVTPASGGDESITYSWRSSADSYAADIPGADAAAYTPGTLTQTTTFRRYAKDGTCNIVPEQSTGEWTVTVYDDFTPGAIETTGETICYNTAASEIGSVTPAGGGDESITYSWRSSADSYAADIPGADAAAYTPGTLTQTTTFRRYAKDGTCNIVPEQSTGEWTVTVYDDFTPGAIETTGETICYNTAASEIGSVTPAGGGDESITYSWRSSADSYTADIPGADAAAYTPGTLTQTTTFRRYANDETCNTDPEQSTGEWTVTVYDDFTPGAIETTGETICYNTAASEIGSLTPASGGDESITYAWRSSADSYSADIPGADASAYTPGTLTQTTTFRRYAKDGTCNTVPEQSTGEWTVTVYDDFTPGAIETTGETICYNTAASEIGSLTPASGGDESITYSWRSSADSYAADIPGADAATYTPGTLTQTTTFRRYAHDGTCNTEPEQSTGEWTVTIESYGMPEVTIAQTAGNNPCCPEDVVTFEATPVNGGANPSYQWYVNGTPAGTDTPVFNFDPADGDQISVMMTTSILCPTVANATSNTITMQEINPATVMVSMRATKGTGREVIFTAYPVNGGANPVYKWYKNNVLVQEGSSPVLSSECTAGDEHYVELYSSLPCAVKATSLVYCSY